MVMLPFTVPTIASLKRKGLQIVLVCLTLLSLLPKLAYSYDLGAWTLMEGMLNAKTHPNILFWNVTRFNPFYCLIEVRPKQLAERPGPAACCAKAYALTEWVSHVKLTENACVVGGVLYMYTHIHHCWYSSRPHCGAAGWQKCSVCWSVRRTTACRNWSLCSKHTNVWITVLAKCTCKVLDCLRQKACVFNSK
jgi:hypothetical protein